MQRKKCLKKILKEDEKNAIKKYNNYKLKKQVKDEKLTYFKVRNIARE